MQHALHSAKAFGKDVASHTSSAVMTMGHRVAKSIPARHHPAPSAELVEKPSLQQPPIVASTCTPATVPDIASRPIPPSTKATAANHEWQEGPLCNNSSSPQRAVAKKPAEPYVSPYAPVPSSCSAGSDSLSAARPTKPHGVQPRQTKVSGRHVVNSRAFVRYDRPVRVVTTQVVAVQRLVRAWRAYVVRRKRVEACILLQSIARRMYAQRQFELLRAPSAISFDSSSDGRASSKEPVTSSWSDDYEADNECDSDSGGDSDEFDLRWAPHPSIGMNVGVPDAGSWSAPPQSNDGQHHGNDGKSASVEVLWNRRTHPVLGLRMAWNAGLGMPVVETVGRYGNDIPGRSQVRVNDYLSHVQNTPMSGVREWRAALKEGDDHVLLRFQRPPV